MSATKSIQLRQILSTCPKSKMPKDLEPMSPTLIPEPFNHADWQFEIKWDGFRMLSYCEDKIVNLRSKNNHSFNRKFPAIRTELEGLGLNAILDGELVVLNERGAADFNKIMSAINTGTLVYYVFDILWFEGYNLMNASSESLDYEDLIGIDAIFMGLAINANVTPSTRINITIELATAQ